MSKLVLFDCFLRFEKKRKRNERQSNVFLFQTVRSVCSILFSHMYIFDIHYNYVTNHLTKEIDKKSTID